MSKICTKFFVIEDGPIGNAIYYPKSRYYSEYLDRWIHDKVGFTLRVVNRENAGVNYIKPIIELIEGNSMLRKYRDHVRATQRQLQKEQTILKRLMKGA
jgi:hypothetical protein